MVVKSYEPELSYILAELFTMCLKESCFPDCLKVSPVVPVFKNVGERSTAKNYDPVSLLSVVSKVFEKLLNNRGFDRSGATRAVALDISEALDRVWHAGLLHKLKSYGISGQIFGLISSFLSNRQLWVVLDGKSLQENPVIQLFNYSWSSTFPSLFNKNLDWCVENNTCIACLACKARHGNFPISHAAHVNEVCCAPLHDT